MTESEFNHKHDPEKQNSEEEPYLMPPDLQEQSFNTLSMPREPILLTLAELIKDGSLHRFYPLNILPSPQENLSLKREKIQAGERYYVSGQANAKAVLNQILSLLEPLPLEHTLAIDMAQICATHDFIEGIVKPLISLTAKRNPLILGKQIVFLDPDPTTHLSLTRVVENELSGNAVVMIADTTNPKRWIFRTVGHLEKHLKKILLYVREQKTIASINDIYNAQASTSQANASSAVKQLWDLGLLRRTKTNPSGEKVGRVVNIYTPYHPSLDTLPPIPTLHWDLLAYDDQLSPRRQRK